VAIWLPADEIALSIACCADWNGAPSIRSYETNRPAVSTTATQVRHPSAIDSTMARSIPILASSRPGLRVSINGGMSTPRGGLEQCD